MRAGESSGVFLGAGKDGGAGPLRRRPLRRAPAASDVTSALSIQPRGWGCHIPARGDDACGSRAGSAGQTKREELLFVYANLAAMSAPLRRSWTQDEFFAWAGSQEGRYEFDGFQPVAMTGGTVNHALIIRSLHRALDRRLHGGRCQPLGPDAGVATIGTAVRYPDALVTCAKLDGDALIVPGVVIVFEVLSSSTSRTDRIIKVREYGAVASMRRYVIVESTSVGLTVLERQGPDEAWRVTTLTSDDVLRMPEIDSEIPVAEFYDGVSFPEETAAGT